MSLRLFEYVLSGALFPLFLGSLTLAFGLLLWNLRKREPAGRTLLLVARGVGLPVVVLSVVLCSLSAVHTLIYVRLNGSLPPFLDHSVPGYAPGTVEHLPEVTLNLEDGREIKAQLNPYAAPNTVHSFLELAESGFFDGFVFRRLETKLIEVGDPKLPLMRDLLPGPGYNVHGEFAGNGYPNWMKFDRGDIGLAMQFGFTAAPGAFFIMTLDSPSYTETMPAFGRIVEGMGTVDDIRSGEIVTIAGIAVSLDPVAISSVTVETFGEDYPAPIKLPDTALRIQVAMIGDWIAEAEAVVDNREVHGLKRNQ